MVCTAGYFYSEDIWYNGTCEAISAVFYALEGSSSTALPDTAANYTCWPNGDGPHDSYILEATLYVNLPAPTSAPDGWVYLVTWYQYDGGTVNCTGNPYSILATPSDGQCRASGTDTDYYYLGYCEDGIAYVYTCTKSGCPESSCTLWSTDDVWPYTPCCNNDPDEGPGYAYQGWGCGAPSSCGSSSGSSSASGFASTSGSTTSSTTSAITTSNQGSNDLSTGSYINTSSNGVIATAVVVHIVICYFSFYYGDDVLRNR